jgi:hypothetical protein
MHAFPPLPQLVGLWPGSQVVALLQHPAHPLDLLQTHLLLEQVVPAAHAVPHMPQLFGSREVSTHRAPHCVYPAAALHGKPHMPPEHVDIALGTFAQAWLQVPQFCGSF